MCLISYNVPYEYKHEYHAFGKIEGQPYQAVPLTDLVSWGLGNLNTRTQYEKNCSPARDTLSAEISRARIIAKLFRKDFELPMAVYLLTLQSRTQSEIKQIASSLSEDFVVPEDWCEDSTILAPKSSFFGGFEDAACANDLLQAILNKQYGRGAARAAKTKALQQVKAELKEERSKEERSSTLESEDLTPTESKGRKRMLDDLYIGLNGWESHLPNKMRATDSNRVGGHD
jgi:hypothetical protein